MSILLKNLPKEIKDRALVYIDEDRVKELYKQSIIEMPINHLFNYSETKEGNEVWKEVAVGSFKPFYDFYGMSFPLIDDEKTSDFKTICVNLSKFLEEKNKRYGNSALESLSIFTDKCKTGQRMDDKLSRIKNSNTLRKNDLVDLIGYCILTCKEKGWTFFNDLID